MPDSEPVGRPVHVRPFVSGGREAAPLKIPVALFTAAAVALPTLAWNAVSYRWHGNLNGAYFVLSLFLMINLLIAYWECCLYWRRDYVEERTRYWRERQAATGRTPAVEFLASSVALRRILSPTVWADVWATYAQFDSSYADRRSYGFNVDIANGFFTPIASLVLLGAMTFGFLPAAVAGILGIALFWQWFYVSSLYVVSFFVAGRQRKITRAQVWIFIAGPNSVWIITPLLGLYVAVRLTLEGHYGVLGH